jgi:hypothetical protein
MGENSRSQQKERIGSRGSNDDVLAGELDLDQIEDRTISAWRL